MIGRRPPAVAISADSRAVYVANTLDDTISVVLFNHNVMKSRSISRGDRVEAIFGNSPFLSHAVISEPGFVRELLEQGVDIVFAELLAGLLNLVELISDRVPNRVVFVARVICAAGKFA